mgnify:FL=1
MWYEKNALCITRTPEVVLGDFVTLISSSITYRKGVGKFQKFFNSAKRIIFAAY